MEFKKEYYGAKKVYKQQASSLEKFTKRDNDELEAFNNILENNQKLIMTDRGTSKSFQTMIQLVEDKNLVVIVATQEDKEQFYKRMQGHYHMKHKDREEMRQAMLRVYTVDQWKNGGYKYELPYRRKIHIEDVEKVMAEFIGIDPSTMTTGFYSVYGFTNQFEKAEFVNFKINK